MGASSRPLTPLTEALAFGEAKVGANAVRLSQLGRADMRPLRPPALEDDAARLERRLYDAVGPGRQREAAEIIETGRLRIVRSTDELKRFRAGEVLACQVIEPTMTQLVPLACAVVERRGGMLIHGAIIARELGIPCVNGIEDLLGRLTHGDGVTVAGKQG